MTNRIQSLRSSVAGARPAGQIPGTIYTNFADRQIGVVNPSNAALDFVAVRFHSTTASYVAGDYVVIGGQMYRAPGPIGPGAFNAGQWVAVGGAVFNQSLNTFDNVLFNTVGIGTPQAGFPGAPLHVIGAGNSNFFNATIVAQNGFDPKYGYYSQADGYQWSTRVATINGPTINNGEWVLSYDSAPIDCLVVNRSGDVGIRTAPSSMGSEFTTLDIKGQSAGRTGALFLRSADDSHKMFMYASYGASYLGTITAQPLAFMTANAERMRIDAAGNVGIGRTPTQLVDIFKQEDAATLLQVMNNSGGASTQAIVRVTNATTSTTLGHFGTGATGSGPFKTNSGYLQTSGDQLSILSATGPIVFGNNSAEFARIDAAGNVGIGMTPAQVLDILKNVNGGAQVRLTNLDGGTGSYAGYFASNNTHTLSMYVYGTGVPASGLDGPGSAQIFGNGTNLVVGTGVASPVILATGGTEKMRIAANGNVGIGKTNPQGKLDIAGDQNSELYAQITNTNSGSAARSSFYLSNGTHSGYLQHFGLGWAPGGPYRVDGTILGGNGAGGLTLETDAVAPIYFATNGVERGRFEPVGGNAYFRASSSGGYGYPGTPLHEFMQTLPGNLCLNIGHAGSSPYGFTIGYSAAAPNDSTYFAQYFDTASPRFYFFAHGGMSNFSANNGNLSDARLKDQVTIYSEAELSALEASFLKVNWGKWKYNDQTHSDWNHGTTAQSVEEAFALTAPELIDEVDMAVRSDPSDKTTPAKMRKIIYETDLTYISRALLARALTEIKELKATVAALLGGKPASA